MGPPQRLLGSPLTCPGETLSELASLSTLSLIVCDQNVHTNIQAGGGMSFPLRLREPGYFFLFWTLEGGVW